jgi:hypothetical protein
MLSLSKHERQREQTQPMHRPALALLLLAASAASAFAAEKQVYRLDSVTAVATKGSIQVQVTGAVRSGGWDNVRLKLVKSGSGSIVLEFLAQPPAASEVVIQALLPVSAQVTIKGGADVTSVRVVADANEITAQVLR